METHLLYIGIYYVGNKGEHAIFHVGFFLFFFLILMIELFPCSISSIFFPCLFSFLIIKYNNYHIIFIIIEIHKLRVERKVWFYFLKFIYIFKNKKINNFHLFLF